MIKLKSLYSLQKPNLLRFALFSAPAGAIPQKKVVPRHTMTVEAFVELGDAVSNAYTARMCYEYINSNPKLVTDPLLSLCWVRIANYKLELDSNFYDKFLPLTMEYIKTFTRDEANSLSQIISEAGKINLQHSAFWELVEQKLLKDNLVKYISLRQLCKVIRGMGSVKAGSEALFQKFEKDILKFRLALSEDDAQCVKTGFEKRGLGSSLLYKVLENPRGIYSELQPNEINHKH